VLVVFTVLPWINPTYRLVSADASSYYTPLFRMRSTDFNSAMSYAFASDRPAFYSLIYSMSIIIPPIDLLQFLPALLIPVYVLLCVLLMRRLRGPREAPIYAALIVPLSFQALGLIYSGYFANMLALIFVFIYYILFLKTQVKPSFIGLWTLLGTSILILFSHPWTWFIFALSLLAFLLIEYRKSSKIPGSSQQFKFKAILIVATIAADVASDVVKGLLTHSSLIGASIGTVASISSLPVGALAGMSQTVYFYLGGVFANQLLIVLAIIGFALLLVNESEASSLLVSWVFVACISVFFTSTQFAYNRLLFLMPFGIFASLGISHLIRLLRQKNTGNNTRNYAVWALLLLIIMILLNNGLRYVTNINLL
jgi:hypothetical protein